MIELPATLAAWATELGRLPVELALTIAPWVNRLALAIGPWPVSATGGGHEPDGIGGLARRGSYERLLASEWAVADLYPDEFVRRAIAHEHLFLDVARRQPRGARRCVVIVSAGPAQLGAPRLAHVAALAVLARRAVAAGAEPAWGVLEDAQRTIHRDVDGAGIRRLLDARTTRSASADDVAGWRAALDVGAGGERWWIGDAADLELPRRAGEPCLVVGDVLEPEVRALDVEVHRRGRQARVRLPLPSSQVATRLVRDPRTARRETPGRIGCLADGAVAIRFGPHGRRLAIALADGTIESWPIPGSPAEPLGQPRRWSPPAGHLLAFGIDGRTALAATLPPDGTGALAIAQATRAGSIAVEVPTDLDAPLRHSADDSGRCGMLRSTLVLQLPRALLAVSPWPAARPAPHARPLSDPSSEMLGAAFQKDEVNWAELRPSGEVKLRRYLDGAAFGPRPVMIDLATAEPLADVEGWPYALFGFDTTGQKWGPVALVWEQRCDLLSGVERRRIELDAPAVGVGRWKPDRAAVLVQPASDRLEWRGVDDAPPLPCRRFADLVDIEVCATRPYVAWCTAGGHVHVYSVVQRAELMHLVPAAENDGPVSR